MARKKRNLKVINTLAGVVFIVLTIYAIREQLRRAPEERTWHGTIFGIPYDFRLPTAERLRTTFWNKDSSQLLVPQVFGIGWTLNLYPLVHPQTVTRLS
jgi:uncharacterized membrane protein